MEKLLKKKKFSKSDIDYRIYSSSWDWDDIEDESFKSILWKHRWAIRIYKDSSILSVCFLALCSLFLYGLYEEKFMMVYMSYPLTGLLLIYLYCFRLYRLKTKCNEDIILFLKNNNQRLVKEKLSYD